MLVEVLSFKHGSYRRSRRCLDTASLEVLAAQQASSALGATSPHWKLSVMPLTVKAPKFKSALSIGKDEETVLPRLYKSLLEKTRRGGTQAK